ncbi:MAG TPA: cytochrome c [Anaerolineales bacterium]|nr:cytochrome c [Anaerolineales bacterium]
MKKLLLIVLSIILLTACGSQADEFRPGMGMGSDNMMNRHHAQIPAEYAGLKNPVPSDEASLERGAQLYATNCASCHGDGGMGDGPAGAALDPAPAAVAHTSQMMADDYLFWRISEGGPEFSTSMPPWKVLPEQARWDMVNYIRALGAGTVKPDSVMGGVPFDPTAQAAKQTELLAKAVEQKVVTQAEADLFITVHDAMEQYRIDHPELTNSGDNATDREAAILSALVAENVVTQEQADAFPDIHDRLGNAGLMP